MRSVKSPLPKPSSRLVRAAAAEQADLTRHRDRLSRDRERLLGELERVDADLAAVDQRLQVVVALIDADLLDPHDPPAALRGITTTDAPAPPAGEPTRTALRGPAIRETAVQVLIAQPEQIEAIHYRRWYDLLVAAGYAVAGKDPLAAFLTQVTRSPVVHKSTKPGVYEVDQRAPLRIRQKLERLQAELREATITPVAPVDLAGVRARRHELDLSISQQERALVEALRSLSRDGSDAPRASAVSR
jgi:hypothetical protein